MALDEREFFNQPPETKPASPAAGHRVAAERIVIPASADSTNETLPPPRHWAVRAVRVVGGFALLIAGVAMLALPGPGWLAIGLGLTLLASEFRWARRLLIRLRKTLRRYVPRRKTPRRSSDVNDTTSQGR